MDVFDDEFDEEEIEELDQSEVELQALEARIEKVRGPAKGGNRKFAQGVALVTSLGFVVAVFLYGGVRFGDYLALRTGSDSYKLLGVMSGLMMALFSAVKLMRPLLKSDD